MYHQNQSFYLRRENIMFYNQQSHCSHFQHLYNTRSLITLQHYVALQSMNILLKHILLIFLLLPFICPIFLPLTPKRPRCMMVYSVGESQTVKIDLNLPNLPNQTDRQGYELTMRNTETQEVMRDNSISGSFKKQYSLTPNVIYEFCITMNTQRNIDNISVSYVAETVFHIAHDQIKIPDHLLKKEDFKGTYEAAFQIGDTVKAYTQMQKQRDISANNNFIETQAVDKNLITFSIIQIAIIIAAGVYQYYSLQNYLTSKQYI